MLEFVNADTLAAGLSAFHQESVALEAGRIMLRRLNELAGQRVNFAFETTLASRSFAPWLSGLCQVGYAFHLIFLWLPTPELAIERVLERVRQGGHNIPEETIRRRYHRGIANFFTLYQPLTDHWRFYDNAGRSGPRSVASGVGSQENVYDHKVWSIVKRIAHGKTGEE